MAEIFLFAVKQVRSGRDISFCSSCVFQNKTKGKDTLKRMGLGFFETCCLFSVGVCVFSVWSVSKRTVRNKTETPLPAATAAALVTYEENTNN